MGGELGWREPGNEAGEMYYIVALKWLEKKKKTIKTTSIMVSNL